MIAWLTAALAQFTGSWPLVGHLLAGLAGPAGSAPTTGLMVLAAVALTGVLAAVLAYGGRAAVLTARPLTARANAQRDKSLGAAFQRQLNPDAAGRARPRAPSAAPAAA